MIVPLEGVDAVGKSTHVAHLALALRRLGLCALPWHHQPPPPQLGAYGRALHFALERAALVDVWIPATGAGTQVVVCDRWWPSTEVAVSLGREPTMAGRSLVSAERWALPPAHVILLHAPQDEIERRLRARGESIDGVAAQQAEYIRLAEHQGWPAVATTLPREQVTERLVQIVRGWL